MLPWVLISTVGSMKKPRSPEQAGLVSRRKQGREVLYQVEADRLDQATRAMADLAAHWDRRLGAIKRLAEAAHAQAKKNEGSNPPLEGDRHDG
jgi:peptidoglycan hydrolase CwlO-like protein